MVIRVVFNSETVKANYKRQRCCELQLDKHQMSVFHSKDYTHHALVTGLHGTTQSQMQRTGPHNHVTTRRPTETH